MIMFIFPNKSMASFFRVSSSDKNVSDSELCIAKYIGDTFLQAKIFTFMAFKKIKDIPNLQGALPIVSSIHLLNGEKSKLLLNLIRLPTFSMYVFLSLLILLSAIVDSVKELIKVIS